MEGGQDSSRNSPSAVGVESAAHRNSHNNPSAAEDHSGMDPDGRLSRPAQPVVIAQSRLPGSRARRQIAEYQNRSRMRAWHCSLFQEKKKRPLRKQSNPVPMEWQ